MTDTPENTTTQISYEEALKRYEMVWILNTEEYVSTD